MQVRNVFDSRCEDAIAELSRRFRNAADAPVERTGVSVHFVLGARLPHAADQV
jgi:hypothetical protein